MKTPTLLLFLAALALPSCGADAPPPGIGAAPVSCQAADPCPYQTPYCLAGACAPCSADPSLCRGRTPYCLGPEAGEEAGRCGACRAHEDCASAGLCWHGVCLPTCRSHADCPRDSACLWSDDGERGGCAPSEETMSVDAPAALPAALATVANQEQLRQSALSLGLPTLPPLRIVRLRPAPAPYPMAVVTSSVTLVGDGVATTRIGADPRRDGIRIVETRGAAVVRLQRLSIEDVSRGVLCDTPPEAERGTVPRVSLVEVSIKRSRGTGLELRGCNFTMDRVAVTNAGDGVLTADAPGHFTITNSVFADSGASSAPMLYFHGATGEMRFSTLINNVSVVSRAVGCAWAPVTLSHLLILRSHPPDLVPFQDPLSGDCALADVVLDVESRYPGAVRGKPELVNALPYGDYPPVQSSETLGCCLRNAVPGPLHDFAGTARQYPLATLGAYEVVR